MWIEITDEGGTRLVNMERVEIVNVDIDSLVFTFTGQDCTGRFGCETREQAQAEYERIKGLLISDNNQ